MLRTEGCTAGTCMVRSEIQQRRELALLSPSSPLAQWWRYCLHLRSHWWRTGFSGRGLVNIFGIWLPSAELVSFWYFFGFIFTEHGNMLHWMGARNPVPDMGLPFQGEDETLWDWWGKLSHSAHFLYHGHILILSERVLMWFSLWWVLNTYWPLRDFNFSTSCL